MIKILKSKRGENYIDTVVGVIAAMMVIVVALNIFSFLTLKQDLDYYAKEMVEVCCSYGKTCDEVQDRDEELTEEGNDFTEAIENSFYISSVSEELSLDYGTGYP